MKIFDIEENEVITFGSGQGGQEITYLLLKDGYEVVACFDNNASKAGSLIWDKVKVEEPYLIDKDFPIILCMYNKTAISNIKEQCESLGYKKIICIDWEDLDTKYMSNLLDEEYIKVRWKAMYGRELDLSNPITFNEKIQWLKLHSSETELRPLADKIAVKEYVGNIIGFDYIIPTLGCWNHYDEIDFNHLPESFVLKCTHDSGSTTVVRSKERIDHIALRSMYEDKLSVDYYYKGRERCYKGIPRKIIAEPHISPDKELKDYKIHVFSGVPRLIQVDLGRFSSHKRNMYTPDWEYQPFSVLYPTDMTQIEECPGKLPKMFEIATSLSKDFSYVRVDLYTVDDKVYFGELTFFHGSGYEPFDPPEWNKTMGDWIVC